MRYWKLLGEYDAEATTWGAFAGGLGSSPYTPDEDAMLIGLRAVVGRTAATTLTDGVEFRLTSNSFRPNTIECGCVGSGLQTAPAVPAPIIDWDVHQPVKASVKITLEGRNANGSGVTNSVMLFGLFDNGLRV